MKLFNAGKAIKEKALCKTRDGKTIQILSEVPDTPFILGVHADGKGDAWFRDGAYKYAGKSDNDLVSRE